MNAPLDRRAHAKAPTTASSAPDPPHTLAPHTSPAAQALPQRPRLPTEVARLVPQPLPALLSHSR